MTLIGMLHHRKDPTSVIKSYAYAIVSIAEGADFVYFTPNSVDISSNTVNGYVYENGTWLERVTPLPDVIYNAGSPEKLETSKDIINILKERIPFTTNSIGNKWSVTERLKRGNKFGKYLIPTKILMKWEDFHQNLIAFREIVIKPIDGRKGQGIYYIKATDNGFILNNNLEETVYNLEELQKFIKTQLEKTTYIVQPYINSKTKSDNAFDFRLHVQKNGEGKWVITSIYPRIAPAGTIITNINNGGYTNYLEPFLKQEFDEAEAYNIRKMLEYFSISLAEHLDELQMVEYGELIDEIGVDVGLDQHHKIWIYEVNWRPGCPPTFYLEMDVVKNTIRYALYLTRNQQKIKEDIQRVKIKRENMKAIPTIAVTGSAGKTTTKAFISSILNTRMKIFESKDYWNTTEHTRKHAKEINHTHQAVVLEYGMAYPGVITEHCKIIQPNVSVVTNIGLSHIGNFKGDIKKTAHAKSELIHGMDQNGVLFINRDDENSKHLELEHFKGKILTTSIKNPSDYQAYDITYSEMGMSFKMMLKYQEVSFFIPIFGEHNIYNAINAIAVADYLGFTALEIKIGLLFRKPPRRMTIYQLNQSITLIDDTVHAQPEAVIAAIDVLKHLGKGRKVAILGQMRELGELLGEQYKKIGEYVTKQGIDFLITYGYKADAIGTEAIFAGFPDQNVKHFLNKVKMHQFLQDIIQEGDTVLVKGASKVQMFDTVKFLTSTIGENDE